jgi:FkbH-like protein
VEVRGMAYTSKRWIERYSIGFYRPRRVLRHALQDAVVASLLRLQSQISFLSTEGRWLPRRARERWRRMVEAFEFRGHRHRHNYDSFRTPAELKVSDRPLRRVLVVGACLVHWQDVFKSLGIPYDFVLSNNLAQMADTPPASADQYDFQLVQIPLRNVVSDFSLARTPYDDIEAHEALLDHSRQLLAHALSEAMRWNKRYGLLTFVANFLVPQQDPSGRLMPRHDVRNPMYFVEQLNIALSEELRRYQNAYLLDIDQVAATFGKKNIQDDSVYPFNHGAALNNHDFYLDGARIERSPALTEHYEVRSDEFVLAVWAEIVAMHRTINQIDAIKLVVVDLDDTLWRGVVAEEGEITHDTTEGWPLGVMEALCFLKRRGVLLAIVSKNDDGKIVDLWDKITWGRIRLEDFATRRINWQPKAANLEDIIREVNVLPRNVLFIDDNPVERASVKAAFPDIRVLDSRHYYWRRSLLWAPETQVATVTRESGLRTEMVQAQIEREGSRQRLSRPEFLASLGVAVRLFEVNSAEHPSFRRVFELLNKTNQFNTTGRRWTREECLAALSRGRTFFAFEAEDKFTPYGLVGVAIVEGQTIEQFVMSCRVLGLDVEIAVVAALAQRILGDERGELNGQLAATDANAPCRDLFQRCGFESDNGRWIKRSGANLEQPRHVTVVWPQAKIAALPRIINAAASLS